VVLSQTPDSARGESLGRQSLTVDDNGAIILPRLGRLVIATIPARDVADTVRARYRQLYRADDIAVIPLRRVSVLGEVRRPGVYHLDLTATLRDALAEAQGVSEIGNPCCVTVLRGAEKWTLRDWQTLPPAELAFLSGDALVVDREAWIKRNLVSVVSVSVLFLSSLVALRK
jgi:hypothetical protein